MVTLTGQFSYYYLAKPVFIFSYFIVEDFFLF